MRAGCADKVLEYSTPYRVLWCRLALWFNDSSAPMMLGSLASSPVMSSISPRHSAIDPFFLGCLRQALG